LYAEHGSRVDVRHSAASVWCAGIAGSLGFAGGLCSCHASWFGRCVRGCVCRCVTDGVGLTDGVRAGRVAGLRFACSLVDPVVLHVRARSLGGRGVLGSIARLLIAAAPA
jgi:hypothetical protein